MNRKNKKLVAARSVCQSKPPSAFLSLLSPFLSVCVDLVLESSQYVLRSQRIKKAQFDSATEADGIQKRKEGKKLRKLTSASSNARRISRMGPLMFSAVSLPSMRIESHALERELDSESKEAEARTTRRLVDERRRRRAEEEATTTADEDRGVAVGLRRRSCCCNEA